MRLFPLNFHAATHRPPSPRVQRILYAASRLSDIAIAAHQLGILLGRETGKTLLVTSTAKSPAL